MLQLTFAIAAVVCLWLSWNLAYEPLRQWRRHIWLVLFFVGLAFAVLAGVGLPPYHAAPAPSPCGFHC